MREKVEKYRKVETLCFFCNVWLAKAAGGEPSGHTQKKNCTPLWRKAHLEVKMTKTPQVRIEISRNQTEIDRDR